MSLTRIYLPLNAARLRELARAASSGRRRCRRTASPTVSVRRTRPVTRRSGSTSRSARPPRPPRPACRRGSAGASWLLPTSTTRGSPPRTVDGVGVGRHRVAAGADAAHRLVPRRRERRRGRRRAAVVRRHRAGRPCSTCSDAVSRRPSSPRSCPEAHGHRRGQPACAASQGSTQRVEGLGLVAADAVAGAGDDRDLEVRVAQVLDRPRACPRRGSRRRVPVTTRVGTLMPAAIVVHGVSRKARPVARKPRSPSALARAPRLELGRGPAGVLGPALVHRRRVVVAELLGTSPRAAPRSRAGPPRTPSRTTPGPPAPPHGRARGGAPRPPPRCHRPSSARPAPRARRPPRGDLRDHLHGVAVHQLDRVVGQLLGRVAR